MPEIRICSVEGCDKQLRSSNTSGRCTSHYYVPKGRRPKQGRSKSKSTQLAVARRAAARVVPAEECATLRLTGVQLSGLFAALPLERKAACLQAYLDSAGN